MKITSLIKHLSLAILAWLMVTPAFAGQVTETLIEGVTGGTFLNFAKTSIGETRNGISISQIVLGPSVPNLKTGSGTVNWSADDSSDGTRFDDSRSIEDNNIRNGPTTAVPPWVGSSFVDFRVTLSNLTANATYQLKIVGVGLRQDFVSDPTGILPVFQPSYGIGTYDGSYTNSAGGSMVTVSNFAAGSLVYEETGSTAISGLGTLKYYKGSYAENMGFYTADANGEIPLHIGQGNVNTYANGARTMLDGIVVLGPLSETTPPTVKITSPKAKYETNNVLLVSGTATDNVAVTNVLVRVRGTAWQAATVTGAPGASVTWNAALTLFAGTNIVEAMAVDSSGLESAKASVQTFGKTLGTLTVIIAGSGTGTVVTNVTADKLFVGRGGFKVTATAAPNNVFSNWLMSVNGQATNLVMIGHDNSGNESIYITNAPGAPLTFAMASNVVLYAQFVTNKTVGVYNGLVVDTNGAAHPSSGFFTVKVDSKQKFSGKLYVDGDKVAFSGVLGVNGTGWSTMKAGKENRLKFDKSPVYVRLTVDYENGGDVVSGIATNVNWGTNEVWYSTLDGDRNTFSKDLLDCTNYAGTYTLVIPGATPVLGDSYALVTVGLDGKVKASGLLAESAGGKAVKLGTMSTTIGKNGEWPFHVQKLYPEARTVLGKTYKEYQGSVMGWLTFTGDPSPRDLGGVGQLLWVKPGWTNTWYTGGFTNAITPLGSSYVMPAVGVRALSSIPTDQATVGHTNGLAADFENTFDWLAGETANKLTAQSANQNEEESVAITAKSGKVKGTFFNGAVKTTEEGVLLQDLNVGRGFYLGTSESGAMTLTPK